MNDEKKDLFFLDAKVLVQVSEHAFRAELANGHNLVAYLRCEAPSEIEAGSSVKVCLSPYDMSAGRIVFGDVK